VQSSIAVRVNGKNPEISKKKAVILDHRPLPKFNFDVKD